MLDGRVVLVTGLGQPLGEGIAAALGEKGARVVDTPAPDVDALVHAHVEPAALTPRQFMDAGDDLWSQVWEGTMRGALTLCQALHPTLARSGRGRVVFVIPTLGMSGAAELAPLATVSEGVRIFAKSTARQWGQDGITVNCVAVAPELAGQQIVARASVRSDVTEVSFVLDGDPVGVVTSGGPAVALIPLRPGSHTLTVVASLRDGTTVTARSSYEVRPR